MRVPNRVAMFVLSLLFQAQIPGNISEEGQFYSLEIIDMALALLRTGLNAFDPKTVLLAKHAQHVVLVHFPIALFIAAVTFDLIAHWTRSRGLADAAYYNLLLAAISAVPVVATGILAWQFQLEGQKLKGILLLHLALAGASSVLIWLVSGGYISAQGGGQKPYQTTASRSSF
jgi:predicted membrane protein DUF2231